MTPEEFYGSAYADMLKAEAMLVKLISEYSATKRKKEGVKPIVYSCSRIKSPESMIRKLEERGFEQTREAALEKFDWSKGCMCFCRRCLSLGALVKGTE